MNFYAKKLREGHQDVPIEVRYAILCAIIAEDRENIESNLIALTNEYKNLKGCETNANRTIERSVS